MTYLWALLLGLVGGGLGFMLGAAAASALAPSLGIGSFEGAAGSFAVFVGGPIGGLAGFLAGAFIVLRRAGHRSAGAVGGRLALVTLAAIALGAAALGAFWSLRPLVNANGPAPELVFEIRLPPGTTPPSAGQSPVELQTARNRMPARLQAGRVEDGRPIMVGSVELYYRTWQRTLVLTMPDKTDVLFDISLGLTPEHTKGFGEWHRADYIALPGGGRSRRASSSDRYEIRYRVEWAGRD